MARDLRSDTKLTPDPSRPGRLLGNIPEGWKVVYVFGGVSMYAALRAMHEALDRPDLELVTANAIFIAPVPPGPVMVDVEVLRNGRRAAQVAADVRVPGVEGVALRAHGVFGAAHDTEFMHQEVVFPEVPLPGDIAMPDLARPAPFERPLFHQQTDWRPVTPLDDAGRGQFLSWVRLIEGEPDRLTLAVHGDVIGPAIGRALRADLSETEMLMSLSLEIGIRFVRAPATQWVLQEIEAWHIGEGYATGPARLWDEDGNLCAIASQTAHLRRAAPL